MKNEHENFQNSYKDELYLTPSDTYDAQDVRLEHQLMSDVSIAGCND